MWGQEEGQRKRVLEEAIIPIILSHASCLTQQNDVQLDRLD